MDAAAVGTCEASAPRIAEWLGKRTRICFPKFDDRAYSPHPTCRLQTPWARKASHPQIRVWVTAKPRRTSGRPSALRTNGSPQPAQRPGLPAGCEASRPSPSARPAACWSRRIRVTSWRQPRPFLGTLTAGLADGRPGWPTLERTRRLGPMDWTESRIAAWRRLRSGSEDPQRAPMRSPRGRTEAAPQRRPARPQPARRWQAKEHPGRLFIPAINGRDSAWSFAFAVNRWCVLRGIGTGSGAAARLPATFRQMASFSRPRW
jgi:hypothetical protein